MKPIGVVLGRREATPLEFWVGVEDGALLRLDDLVYAESEHAGQRVRYYGMVDQVIKLHEGSQFDSDAFLVRDNLLPVNTAYVAHVSVTRLDPEDYLPPSPGSPVFLARGESLSHALYYDAMDERLPVGLLRNGEPAYVNLEFLDGRRGGHVNISGISGVAAKTSYALFLLHSLYRSGVLAEAGQARTLIFNVKGQDLFYLDKQNLKFSDADRDHYRALGLPAEPFRSVAFLAPPAHRPGEGEIVPEVVGRFDAVRPYHWDIVQFARGGFLPFLFTDRGAMTNLGFLIDQVSAKLAQLAKGQSGPGLVVDDWDDAEAIEARPSTFDALGRPLISTFSHLVRYIEYKLLEANEGNGDPAWVGRQARGTLEAFIRRLRAAAKAVERLVRGDRPGNPPNPLAGDHLIHVVDIHRLAPQAQMFVVGSLLREVFLAKEENRFRGKIFVVLDELNKYAPREGESPIKDILLDIAERGRSLGVILIGAQQTASEVERRVVANAAIRVVGRLDAAEAERPEYRFLPGAIRDRAMILPQGTMILHQPQVPVPLLVTFPYPAWATKKSEVKEDVSAGRLRDELGL